MNYLREYKSSVFSMLTEIPEYALDIYNALNDTSYHDPNAVEIVKLKNGIVLSMRNDASFVLDSFLNLYEHQSTYNPNMPLRFLIYFANMMQEQIKQNDRNMFGRRRIMLPTPRFVVFYNGREDRPDVEVLKLSDSYEKQQDEYQLDLICTIYNINPDHNQKLMKKSSVLSGYAFFVDRVRYYCGRKQELEDAVRHAIDECIEQSILADFFASRKEEVLEMAVLDFTFERQLELTRRDEYEDGWSDGRLEGRREGRLEGQREGRLEGRREGRAEEIIGIMEDAMQPEEQILKKLQQRLDIDEKQAREYYGRFSSRK